MKDNNGVRQMMMAVNALQRLLPGTSTGNTMQVNSWEDFGWPDELEFSWLYKMYRRNGIAAAIVEKPVDYCWSNDPAIWEGKETDSPENRKPTEFELTVSAIADRLGLFKKLKQADQKGRVGFYSGLLIRVAGTTEDEKNWSAPLGKIRADQIVQLIPVYSEQLKPSEFDTSPASMRFGQPTMYNYNGSSGIQQTQSAITDQSLIIHHSRVIVFTENQDSESIEGTPALSSAFNYLLVDDLIVGSGGQGFWKNSGNKVALTAKDTNQQAPTEEEANMIREQFDQFNEGLFKQLMLGGVDINQLKVDLNDPKPFSDIILQRVSAASRIPQNILNGTQTGVLAGDKDMSMFLQEMNSRCKNWCAHMVNAFVDWCIEHQALPAVRYSVKFPNLQADTDEQKLTLVGKMVDANQKHLAAQASAGITERMPLFTDEEIRMMAGYKALKHADALPVDDNIEDPEQPL